MQLELVFEDLNEFVEAYQGRLSLEGLIVLSDTRYPAGTVLDLDISLDNDLTLVRGKALVARSTPEGARHEHIMRLIELDEQSIELIERMQRRGEEAGVAPFDLERRLEQTQRLESVPRPQDPPRDPVPESDVYDAVTAALGQPQPQFADGAAREDDDLVSPNRRLRIPRTAALIGIAVVAAAAAIAAMLFFFPGSSDDSAEPGSAAVADPPNGLEAPVPSAAAAENPELDHEPTPTRPPLPTVTPVPGSSIADGASLVTGVRWQASGSRIEVVVEIDGRFSASDVVGTRLDGSPGPRYLLRLIGIRVGRVPIKHRVGAGGIERIRLWQHDEFNPTELYVVLDLASPDVQVAAPVLDGDRVVIGVAAAP